MTSVGSADAAGPRVGAARRRRTAPALRLARRLDAWLAVASAFALVPFLVVSLAGFAYATTLGSGPREAADEAFSLGMFALACGFLASVAEAVRGRFMGPTPTVACALLGANYGTLSAVAYVEYCLRGAVAFHGAMVLADVALCVLALGLPAGVASALVVRSVARRARPTLLARGDSA